MLKLIKSDDLAVNILKFSSFAVSLAVNVKDLL